MADILDLLKASDDPAADQKLFLKAQIVYWLLGATDGHAKNFSLRLMPGGRFRMTPLYDIMSTQPYVDRGQLRRNHMKLAMAAGDKRHRVIAEIMPRHFEQTARKAGVTPALVTAIVGELAESLDPAVDSTLCPPARFLRGAGGRYNTAACAAARGCSRAPAPPRMRPARALPLDMAAQ